MSSQAETNETASADLLEKRIRASRRALLVERIWPRVWFPLAVALVFVIVSLLGIWSFLPPLGHKGLLGVFAIALLASLAPLARLTWPSRDAAVRRLEKKSGIPHRPASAYKDTLSNTGDAQNDRRAQTLWQAHRDRLAAKFGGLRPGTPRPRVDRRDPLALRMGLILATVVAALFAWPTAGERLLSAFHLGPSVSSFDARLDAWVTPPHYTGKAPIMLADGSVAQKLNTDEARMFEVPVGSALIVRASGVDHSAVSVTFRPDGTSDAMALKTETAKADNKVTGSDTAKTPAAVAIAEYRHKLESDGVMSLNINGERLKGWQFRVTPDSPPKIELTRKPGKSARAALALSYRITDDYGVTGGEATFALTDQSRAKAGVTAEAGKSPWPAPKFPLKMTRRNAKKVESRTYQDLTAHPWAGIEVEMTLSARDQAGQVGTLKHVMKLPARNFRKPLAKAVVEQRRKLAINPASRANVATALNALAIAPEMFIPDRTVYLGLRSVYWRLAHDRTNAELKTTVDQLWQIALRIEDGNLSQAERELRDAQDKLAEALKNGASDEEISKLTQELRQALNKFMQSMQRQAQKNQNQQQAQNQNQNSRQLSQRDLDKMLKDIEKLAKSGSRDAAQKMLEQLRNMLEQLQTAQGNPQPNQMQKTIQEFGDLIRDQQRLLDDTFNARQGKGRDGKKGQKNGQQGKNGKGQKGKDGSGRSAGLGKRQGDLKSNLGRLLDSLEGFGGKTPSQLQGAQRAMRGAQQSLEKGDLDRATGKQSKALDQLRKGTQQMAEEMLKGMAGQMGRQQRDPFGRGREPDNNGNQTGEGVKVPGEIDVQKARRILEELRRRASDPNRRSLELDYIERLLERF